MPTTDHAPQAGERDLRPVQASIAWLAADAPLSWDVVKHLLEALNRLATTMSDIDPPRRPDDYQPTSSTPTLRRLHHHLAEASFGATDRRTALHLAWAARDVQAAIRQHESERQRPAGQT